MTQPLIVTPQVTVDRLRSSITEVSDLCSELTAIGLNADMHQATPLQNQLLAGACASLEAWLAIQKEKLSNAEVKARRIPPEAETPPPWIVPGLTATPTS